MACRPLPLALLLGGLTLPSSVLAQAIPVSPPVGDSRPAPTAAAPGLQEADRVVCRSKRHTGSRFPVRTCMTKKEWRMQEENSQLLSDKMNANTKRSLGRESASPRGDIG